LVPANEANLPAIRAMPNSPTQARKRDASEIRSNAGDRHGTEDQDYRSPPAQERRMSITQNLDSRPTPIGASEAEKAPEPKAATLWQISKNVVARISKDNLTLVAAGVAFYAMTAIFPAIAAFVSIYGLFADLNAVQQQISGFAGLLPANSLKLITHALQSFASKSTSSLNVALVVSVGLAIWSAKAGISALISGLNIANETEEKRGFIMQQVIALILTVGAVFFAMVALAAVALLPIVIDVFPLPDALKATLGLGRWPMLVVLVGFGLAVVYRFGPSREHSKWRWITWGAATATVLWIVGSAAFSFYASRFGSYDATYGSLAAPVILLLWFWVSALTVLLGAEIDAELEHADARAARPVPKSAP
jgi:membrane protein